MLLESILFTVELLSKLESVLSNPPTALSTKFMSYSKSFVVISTIKEVHRLLWTWFVAPPNIDNSSIKDHWSRSHNKYNSDGSIWNTVRIAKLWQRHKVNKCYWENDAQWRVATHLQFVKNTVSAKCSETRYAWTWPFFCGFIPFKLTFSQWNRIVNSKLDSHKYRQLVFYKGTKSVSGERINSLFNRLC